MKMFKPEYIETFFCDQILNLHTGEMIEPVDCCDELLRYPNEAYVSPQYRIQVPRINPQREFYEILRSGVFHYPPALEQRYKLDIAKREPIFLTADQFHGSAYFEKNDVSDVLNRYHDYVDNVLGALPIVHFYSDKWREAVLECWARKHNIALLPNPIHDTDEFRSGHNQRIQELMEYHPSISLDYQFTVDQNEVNQYPDVFVWQIPR